MVSRRFCRTWCSTSLRKFCRTWRSTSFIRASSPYSGLPNFVRPPTSPPLLSRIICHLPLSDYVLKYYSGNWWCLVHHMRWWIINPIRVRSLSCPDGTLKIFCGNIFTELHIACAGHSVHFCTIHRMDFVIRLINLSFQSIVLIQCLDTICLTGLASLEVFHV